MERLSIPEHSFVLLDTNVLIDSSKFPEEFSVLYAELRRLEIVPVIESTIRLEFLRGLKRGPEELRAGEEFLTALCGTDHLVLAPDKDIFDRALTIARIYLNADNKSSSVADTLIAAQLSKYARTASTVAELFLATQNHRDFPPVLFDRVDTMLVTLADGSIRTIGFYRFKKARFDQLASV
ncbi:MAG: PIN domain-containing protein [Patescibacteria group bacterium]|nr:PIN domain-containing protein [Patescibacteria group bacterium]